MAGNPEEKGREGTKQKHYSPSMDGAVMVGDGYGLGPRIPVLRNRDTMEAPSPALDVGIPNKVVVRATSTATSTDPCDDPSTPANLCEKPAGGTSMAIPITLGIV